MTSVITIFDTTLNEMANGCLKEFYDSILDSVKRVEGPIESLLKCINNQKRFDSLLKI
jgi:hypothetical protein